MYCADEMGCLPGLLYARAIDEIDIYAKNMGKKETRILKTYFTVQN